MSIPILDGTRTIRNVTSTLRDSLVVVGHSNVAVNDGGGYCYRNLDLDETGILIDIGSVQVYGVTLFNGHATALRYVKLYNKATAPTSSDTPTVTIPIKAQETIEVLANSVGVKFVDGLGMRATTGLSDSDTGAPGTNEVVVNVICSGIGGLLTGVVGDCTAEGATAPSVVGT